MLSPGATDMLGSIEIIIEKNVAERSELKLSLGSGGKRGGGDVGGGVPSEIDVGERGGRKMIGGKGGIKG